MLVPGRGQLRADLLARDANAHDGVSHALEVNVHSRVRRLGESFLSRDALPLISQLEMAYQALLIIFGPLTAKALVTLHGRIGALRLHRRKRIAQLVHAMILAEDVAELAAALLSRVAAGALRRLCLIGLHDCAMLRVDSTALALVALQTLCSARKLGLHVAGAHDWLLQGSQLLYLVEEIGLDLAVLPRATRRFYGRHAAS